MKKTRFAISLFLTGLLLVFSISAQEFKTIRPGIEYSEMTREIDKLPVRINLLRLDLTKVRLDVVHARDAAIGLEKTSSIAARHGAIAAINAGFFRIDKSIFEGDDVGTLMTDGEIVSESYSARIALMIANKSNQTDVLFEHLDSKSIISIGKQTFAVGINRPRAADDFVIYTNSCCRSTLTDMSGIEFIVKDQRIVGISDGKGSSRIPSNGYVLSASGKMREKLLPVMKIGAKVRFSTLISSPDNAARPKFLDEAEDIVSGVPQLIRGGKIDISWEREKSSKSFVETKHPRTAVAKLKDGKFLMITIDGRSEASGGIGLQNLAELLIELGATDAMNLDGGGSTTMFLEGKVVNHPSDKEGERSVGDAILVFPRQWSPPAFAAKGKSNLLLID